MTQLIPGWIRQLTTRKGVSTLLGDLAGLPVREDMGTKTDCVSREQQKQLNICIQSATADIVTRLITADIILSQQAARVEEIVGDMLHRAFRGGKI